MRERMTRPLFRSAPARLACLGLLLIVAVAWASAATRAAPPKNHYSVIDLGNFNDPTCGGNPFLCNFGSGAYGINDKGDVVGWSYYLWDGSVGAFRYIAATGELQRLRSLGGWNGYGYAINATGVVVGTSSATLGFNPNHPAVWENNAPSNLFAGFPTCDLSNPSNYYLNCRGVAFDINSHNHIVGVRSIFSVNPMPNGAFLYADGVFTDLGWLPGDAGSIASAINDRGDIVGTSTDDAANPGMPCCGNDLVTRDGGGEAFLYRSGAMHGIGTLGGPLSGANDISNNGKIVGYSDTAAGARHAFLYTAHRMRDLGTLGGTFSEATAISPRGTVVVGNSTTAAGELHGFIYTRGRMVDLNALLAAGIGVLVDAQDVNDSAQIAGRMIFPGGSVNRAFAVLLTPGGD